MHSKSGLVLLIQTPEGAWRPGIGDPSTIGWLTVIAYFAAAWVCYLAFRTVASAGSDSGRLALAWAVLCSVMAFLGINKQLDLQTLVTVVGRQLAVEQGWYGERRGVQLWFIRGLALLAFTVAIAALWVLRRHIREIWFAALGCVLVSAFVVIRAASFHHIDHFLGTDIHGIRMNWLLELSGIACVGAGATKFRASDRTARSGRRHRNQIKDRPRAP